MSSWKGLSEEGRSILLNDDLMHLCLIMTRKTEQLICSIVDGIIGVHTRYQESAEHLF